MKTIMRSMIALLSLTALLFVSSPRAQAAVCTWNGSTGNWNVATNWSCGVVPGASDEAIISSGTVTLTEDAVVGSLTMSDGTLTGPGDLTAEAINWSRGTMSGSGSTTATVATNFSGSLPMVLQDRTFHNAGAATWNRTGSLNLQTASTVFNNQAGATFTIQSSGSTVVGGAGTFVNAGTFTKASSGETQNSIQFNNSGVVRVESGTLAIGNNYRPSTVTGAYYVASGAILRLQGSQHHNLSGDISTTGEGTIEIVGTVNVDGAFTFPGTTTIYGDPPGTLNLSTDDTTAQIGILNLTYGTVTGPGDLTAGAINWNRGTMSGSGSTTATVAASFTGSLPMVLQDRTFHNAGTATWNRTGSLNLQTASTVFHNQAGATFTVQSSGSTVVGGSGTFVNAGTFTKASLGETENNTQFDNSGVVGVESGTLAIGNNYRPSTVTGAYYVASGAILRLQGSQHHNLSGDISATGEGTIEIAGTVNLDGTFTFPGTTTIYGDPPGTLNLSTDDTTAQIGILNLTYGTVTGPGDLTAGAINWNRGTMSGSGSTTATVAASFTGSLPMVLQDRTFNNAGTATWNRTGYLYLQTASTVFNNQVGATFTVESSGTTVVYGYGTFNNAGTLNLTTGKINAATFVQEPTGTTNLTVKGITPVTDYCQIVASVVNLAGPLNVSFAGGYTPQIGDEFVLLSYSSTRTGDFSPVYAAPIEGISWSSFYEDKMLTLWATTRIYLPLIITESDG